MGFDVYRRLSDGKRLVRICEGEGGGGGKEGFCGRGGGEEDGVYVKMGRRVEVYRLEGGVCGLDREEGGRGDDAAEVEVEDIALVGEREPRGELLVCHGRVGRGPGLAGGWRLETGTKDWRRIWYTDQPHEQRPHNNISYVSKMDTHGPN